MCVAVSDGHSVTKAYRSSTAEGSMVLTWLLRGDEAGGTTSRLRTALEKRDKYLFPITASRVSCVGRDGVDPPAEGFDHGNGCCFGAD